MILGEDFISKFHCTLLLNEPDKNNPDFYYTIRDGVPQLAKSANGVWVNGKRIINEKRLNTGDLITFSSGAEFPQILFIEEQEINPEDTIEHAYDEPTRALISK